MLSVTKHRDASHHTCNARISRRKASGVCPVRGVKTIYAETEDYVRTKAAKWLG